MQETMRLIGLMSGSSLDGLDIACCDFTYSHGKWDFAIVAASCASYDEEWTRRLRQAHELTGRDLWLAHVDFGRYSGQCVREFIAANRLDDITAVASHGHTVFHEPQNGFTTQIGDGAALAVEAGLPVICDFRSGDVAKGGQGAPLVAIGDRLLFAGHRFLLNIGGIANITARQETGMLAFDICSANQILNVHAAQRGMAYDADGALAARGRLNAALFDELNDLPYYRESFPKSLGNDYARNVILPMMEQSNLTVEDKLHTFCDHIAWQIARHVEDLVPVPGDTLLASGGGVLNTYLMTRLQHYLSIPVVPADPQLIAYKEALIFAFLGLLRWRGEANVLSKVTGAVADSISGAIYLP